MEDNTFKRGMFTEPHLSKAYKQKWGNGSKYLNSTLNHEVKIHFHTLVIELAFIQSRVNAKHSIIPTEVKLNFFLFIRDYYFFLSF